MEETPLLSRIAEALDHEDEAENADLAYAVTDDDEQEKRTTRG